MFIIKNLDIIYLDIFPYQEIVRTKDSIFFVYLLIRFGNKTEKFSGKESLG